MEGSIDQPGKTIHILCELLLIERELYAFECSLGDGLVEVITMSDPSEIVAGRRKQVSGSSRRIGVLSLDIDIQNLIADHKFIETEGSILVRCLLSNEGVEVEHLLLLALGDVLDLDVV